MNKLVLLSTLLLAVTATGMGSKNQYAKKPEFPDRLFGTYTESLKDVKLDKCPITTKFFELKSDFTFSKVDTAARLNNKSKCPMMKVLPRTGNFTLAQTAPEDDDGLLFFIELEFSDGKPSFTYNAKFKLDSDTLYLSDNTGPTKYKEFIKLDKECIFDAYPYECATKKK